MNDLINSLPIMATDWGSGVSTTEYMKLKIEARHGLTIYTPEIIMPQMSIEPFSIYDFIKFKANIHKLRSIIRKAKQK